MKEQVSQLMDGELDERGSGATLDALRRDARALEAWRTYHLISDALRDTPLLSDDFAARLAGRLAAEPTVLAPSRARPGVRLVLAAAASFAAVALVAWLAFAPQPQPGPQLAQGPAAAPAAEPKAQIPLVRALPKATNDYLLAHQGFAPRIYLQGMAPYVRTVSEPVDERAR
jgi:sigma-E factor negative regulatory protein RseA